MFKSGSLYFVVDALSKAASFIVLPIITGALSVEDYGLYSLSLTIITFLMVASAVGMDSVFCRMLYEPRISTSELLYTSIWINLRYATPFVTIAIPILYLTSFNLIQSILIVVSFLTYSLLMYPRSYFVAKKQTGSFVIYSLSQFGSFLCLVGLLHYFNNINLTSILAVALSSQLLASFVAYTLFFRTGNIVWSTKLNLRILVRLRKFGKQSYQTSLISYSLLYFDRYVVALLADKSQLGMYAFSLAISGIVKTVGTSLMFAMQPKLYENLKNNEAEKIKRLYLTLNASIPMLYIIFGALVYVLLPYFNKEYQDLNVLIMLIALGAICEIFYMLISVFYSYRYDTKTILKVESHIAVAQLFILPAALHFGHIMLMCVSIVVIAFIKLGVLEFYSMIKFKDDTLGSFFQSSRYMSIVSCGVVFFMYHLFINKPNAIG